MSRGVDRSQDSAPLMWWGGVTCGSEVEKREVKGAGKLKRPFSSD